MRIHPSHAISLAHDAWQIAGHTVRRVLIRRLGGATARVSRLVSTHLTEGPAFGFAVRTSAASLHDLFSSENEARAECDLRRLRTHRPNDRRRLRVDSPTVAPRMLLRLGD